MILGLVGTFAAGKDAAAAYLVERRGFKHVSTGDLVRELVLENGWGGLDRANLQRVATELRQQHGHGHLVDLALKHQPPLVVSGLRNPGEAQTLKDAGGILIAFDAPHDQRWQRAKTRGRIDDALTLQEFEQQQAVEQSKHSHAQNIPGVVEMANHHIYNDGTLEDLYRKLDELLVQLESAQG
jgi:dephospho-CoA kinase